MIAVLQCKLEVKPMYRDFSEKSKNNLLQLVSQVENEKLSDFTDWVGDRWYDFESWIGSLSVKKYINNLNAYHKKVIDKNNTTKEAIIQIFDKVNSVDLSYNRVFENNKDSLAVYLQYIVQLSQIVAPANGAFTAEGLFEKLNPILQEIEHQQLECLRDQMVTNINGKFIFDQDVIYEYIKKSPAEMTDAEQALLLEVIAQLKDTVAFYETLASLGTDALGADVLNYVEWITDSEEYKSFSAVSAHYNELYVNLLNFISEQSQEENTFASSLVNIGIGESVLSILGADIKQDIDSIFGKNVFDVYLAKYVSEHSTQYFGKLELSEMDSLKSKNEVKNVKDYINNELEKIKLRDSAEDTFFVDSSGNSVNEKDAPTFYKTKLKILEAKKEAQARVSIYDGNYDWGDFGELNVTVGEAEAHASVAAGLYYVDGNGSKKFSPRVNAEIGASVTAFEAGWENQLLGDENLGLNADAKVTVGKAEAKAEGSVQIFDEDGKLDIQAGVNAKAEAILAEAEGSIGANVLGGEIGVTGGVNFGVGAHADVGYRDGVFKVDVGASLGVGVSVSVDVDIGGMVDTVCDFSESAWDGVKDGWNTFMSWF